MRAADGTFGNPGIVMISPQTKTINSAPADKRTSRILSECPLGAPRSAASVEKKLGKKIDETYADVEIKSAYCFGNCALGPAAMVDGELVGRASVEKVTA